jgi:hypothetical protein
MLTHLIKNEHGNSRENVALAYLQGYDAYKFCTSQNTCHCHFILIRRIMSHTVTVAQITPQVEKGRDGSNLTGNGLIIQLHLPLSKLPKV